MYKSRLEKVSLANVVLDQVALRNKVDKEVDTWPDFVQSVRDKGILNPPSARILVTNDADNGKYCIIDGMHRYEAALEAGLTEIPLVVYDVTDPVEIMTLQIVGNVHKVETKPVQYRQQIRRILSHREGAITQAELAEMFNRSPTWVSKIMGLNELNEEELKLVDDGTISLSNAYALSRLNERERIEGNWTDRAQTTNPEQFMAEVTQRASALNKRPQSKEEWTAPIVLRKRGDIQNAWFEAHGASGVEKLDPVDIEHIKEEAPQAFALGMYAAYCYCISQDPETVQARTEEHNAKIAASNLKRSETERQALAEKAGKKGVSILAPKGAVNPRGT